MKNYVETRKYNIDLQFYIDFIVNKNRSGSGSMISEMEGVKVRETFRRGSECMHGLPRNF